MKKLLVLLGFVAGAHYSWAGIDLDGDELPEGAYYWVLETGSQVYRGTVTLLRN